MGHLAGAAAGITVRSLCAGLVTALLGGCDTSPAASADEALRQARQTASAEEREWRHYLGDQASRQYSPLAAIHRGNVRNLQVAWTYQATGGKAIAGGQMQHNPLIVRGVLYGVGAGDRLFALNAATGAEIWHFTPADPTGMSTRGVVYWSDGDDERILFSASHYLYAVDASTGKLVPGFGEGGRVDLKEGLASRNLDDTMVIATSPGILYRDLLILGSRVSEFSGAAPGHIRAFDVRTGERRWLFRTIPARGEFGADTWPEAALETAGGANAWAGMALDQERGLVFVPTGSPTFDYYGGDRQGDNLFGNSLVVLDAATGERRWHYQFVRHDLWDRDLPAPPNLVTITHHGQQTDAVAQVTKSGHVFIFDRDSGEPLFPIDEVPVTGEPLPGEFPAASQPVPRLPAPFARQRLTEADIAARDPAEHETLLARFRTLVGEGDFNLPSEQGSLVFPGVDGGAEWGGAAYDPGGGVLYVNANEVPWIIAMQQARGTGEGDIATPEGLYLMTCAGCHGLDREGKAGPSLRGVGSRLAPWTLYSVIHDGRGRMPALGPVFGRLGTLAAMYYLYTAGDDVAAAPPADPETRGATFVNAGWEKFFASDGLPAVDPPWGTLNAIDLDTGAILWRQPLGDYPEAVAMGLRGAGAENYGGPVVTAGGLVFIAATPDEKIRAFDAATGELVWEHGLPNAGFATPSVYEAGGRQYVVIAAGGGKLGRPSGGYFVAFALGDDRQYRDPWPKHFSGGSTGRVLTRHEKHAGRDVP